MFFLFFFSYFLYLCISNEIYENKTVASVFRVKISSAFNSNYSGKIQSYTSAASFVSNNNSLI